MHVFDPIKPNDSVFFFPLFNPVAPSFCPEHAKERRWLERSPEPKHVSLRHFLERAHDLSEWFAASRKIGRTSRSTSSSSVTGSRSSGRSEVVESVMPLGQVQWCEVVYGEGVSCPGPVDLSLLCRADNPIVQI